MCKCISSAAFCTYLRRRLTSKAALQVLDIARKLASSGAESLAALREARLLQACLSIVRAAEPGSQNTKAAVLLLGRFADWDDWSRCEHVLQASGYWLVQSCCCRLISSQQKSQNFVNVVALQEPCIKREAWMTGWQSWCLNDMAGP